MPLVLQSGVTGVGIQTMMVQGEPKVIGKDVTVAEVMEIVEKDRPYYRRTGGGMRSPAEKACVSRNLERHF